MIRLLLLIALLAPAGCKTLEPSEGVALDRIREAVREGVEQAQQQQQQAQGDTRPKVIAHSMPPTPTPTPATRPARPPGAHKRFDVSVAEAPAREFLMGLVDGTPYNMVVHPQVEGSLSLSLKKVTVDEVMRVLRDVYGYEYQRIPSGYQVLPARMGSRIFQVNYLNVKRSGNSEMRVSSGQMVQSGSESSEGGVTNSDSSSETIASTKVITESAADFWFELQEGLKALVGEGEGRSVVVSPQSGIVVVRAMPLELREAEQFLRSMQSTLQRQVILEAKILEVELSDGYQAGINWGALAEGNGNSITFGQTGGGTAFGGTNVLTGIAGNSGNLDPANYASISGLASQAFGGVFTANVKAGNFAAFIELLQGQGNVQVLSSPRVSTVNNQKAVIKVGQDEFFVTDVSTTVVTGNTTSSTPDVTLTPFFSGIALDVTPQISVDGGVTLHIHPSVSEVLDQTKTFTIDDKSQTLPLARSRMRESDSIVYARSGQIVVIGGLMQEITSEEVASPPFFGDLPFLGAAFRHTKQVSRKSELVILLKPLVVDGPGGWAPGLDQSAMRFDSMDRGFHYGGKSEVFGNQAEHRVYPTTTETIN